MKTLAAALICALCAGGCSSQDAHAPRGLRPAQRIVTLMPSFAEDLCAIGAGAQLVGVSAYSGDIPCAKGLPEVNNFAAVNAEKVVQLRADAAIAIPAQRAIAASLTRARVPVVFIADDSYPDIFSALALLGDVSGHEPAARRLIASLKLQTRALQRRARFKRVPRVLFVEQAIPLWTVGPSSYIATLIGLAGGRIVTASLHQAYGQYSDEALLQADPDVIVATPDAHLESALTREPWRSLRAVRRHHVFIAPDSDALVRPGPRYVKGLAWLIARFSSL